MIEFSGTSGTFGLSTERKITSSSGVVVCKCELVDGNDDDLILFSAAPDLLKELQNTHAYLCFSGGDYIGSSRYERNITAIAKALGCRSE